MRLNHRMIALLLSGSALASTPAMTGCMGGWIDSHPYGRDFHRWNPGEDRLYLRWEIETHRNHLEFHRRSPRDQRAYRGWRTG